MSPAMLRVENLHVHFATRGRLLARGRRLRAVDGVDLEIARGQTLGLVGESGCGKTTLIRTILGLQRPHSGRILLEDVDLTRLNRRQMRAVRPRMQAVFQDPYSSLNPRMRVHDIIAEPLRIQGRYDPGRVVELLEAVGLDKAVARRLPAEFSGGQRQRIGIARALALQPDLLVLDEPLSALDVSIQSQIINLLTRLQAERRLTYLFVAHDLSAVRHLSHRIAVMYLGRIVETGSKASLFAEPQHPYTQSLIAAVPASRPEDRDRRRLAPVPGDAPGPAATPSGCGFRTRCPRAQARCAVDAPGLAPAGDAGQESACWFPGSART